MNKNNTRGNILLPTNLYDEARKRVEELKTIEKEKEMDLQKSPQGKIHVVTSKTRTQFYLRTDPGDKSGVYIHKKEESLIKRYLQKTYDEKVQKLIKKEIKSIETLLKHSEDYNLKIQQIYSNNPQVVKNYVRPVDCSDEDYIEYWKGIPYEKNPMPIATVEYKTDNGEYVRSKSEMNIANALLKAGVSYKYECPLKLKNGSVVYPDFTVLDVKNRKLIYWEHRGMMDDRDYVKNSVRKMKSYMKNGIVVGVNLFITEETGANPLGTDEIDEIIKMIK